MKQPWSIRLVRAVFFCLFVWMGMAIALGMEQPAWTGAATGAAAMALLVLLDSVLTRITLRDFSHATFGLGIGLFCAWLVTRIGFFELDYFQSLPHSEALQNLLRIFIYTSLAFFGVTVALRSDRDQFAFLIPYVRFRREAAEGEPLLLDSQSIMDGRIVAVAETGIISGPLVVARPVLDNLQRMADSEQALERARGKRGLEVMEQLRSLKGPRLVLLEPELSGGSIELGGEAHLAPLARTLQARLLTQDPDLARMARLQGVTVLSLAALLAALQPQLQVGEVIEVELIKPGREKHQAVGYLADGSMVVVNHSAEHLGQRVSVTVIGSMATTAGRLIFAELFNRP
jgi:uncharacterized protein YacL